MPRKSAKRSVRRANGYIHVAKPAAASQIMRDLGISQSEARRLSQALPA